MFNSTKILTEAFINQLVDYFFSIYGNPDPNYVSTLRWSGHMALGTIANSDALYHNVEHTIMVTSVGQEILLGKQLADGSIAPCDCLHYMISLLCHDIGYVRGICPGDTETHCIINFKGDTVELPPGATDAWLAPYHIERGKLFVKTRFANHPIINANRVMANIEFTRFPVPQDGDHDGTRDFPALVRAADLIGQLADPHYLLKLSPLFHEFRETGADLKLGYRHPDDLRCAYPKFYWTMVRPFIGDALRYLGLTQTGKQWIANLYSQVFTQEQNCTTLAPLN